MPEIAQDLITFGVEIFIFGLILNFRSLQVCRKVSQAGYLLLERLKKYLQASPILKNPQKNTGLSIF